MRPDMEDYDELNTDAGAPRSRAMSWVVLGVAVGGFAALAYYAYHSGTRPAEGDLMLVEAEDAPIKQIPEDLEGEEFANQDKTIYDVITPGAQNGEKVEKLLPEPEKPMLVQRDVRPSEEAAAEPAPVVQPMKKEPEAATFVNPSLQAASPAVDPVDAKALQQAAPAPAPVASAADKAPPLVLKAESTAAAPAPAPVAVVKEAPKPVAKAPVKEVSKVAPVKKEAAVAAKPAEVGAPKMVNETTLIGKKDEAVEESEVAEAEEAPAPAPAKAAEPAATGAMIQLGAYQSQEEAEAAWKKISAKFGSVLKGGPTITKAELEKGTFYRLRTGGFASADAAKAACTKLSAQKQACLVVK